MQNLISYQAKILSYRAKIHFLPSKYSFLIEQSIRTHKLIVNFNAQTEFGFRILSLFDLNIFRPSRSSHCNVEIAFPTPNCKCCNEIYVSCDDCLKMQPRRGRQNVEIWCQFHQHFKSSFYAGIIAPKKSNLNVSTKKLCAKLSYEKVTCKMLVKLTTGYKGSYVNDVTFLEMENLRLNTLKKEAGG